MAKILQQIENIEPDLPNRPGWAPLALACLFSRRAIVEMLLGRDDANPDSLGPSGMTQLMYAVPLGWRGLLG